MTNGFGGSLKEHQVSIDTVIGDEVLCAIGFEPDEVRVECRHMEQLDPRTISGRR